MENPDLVLQETGSRPTYSRLNDVPFGDTLRRDAISSLFCQTYLFLWNFFTFLQFQSLLQTLAGDEYLDNNGDRKLDPRSVVFCCNFWDEVPEGDKPATKYNSKHPELGII